MLLKKLSPTDLGKEVCSYQKAKLIRLFNKTHQLRILYDYQNIRDYQFHFARFPTERWLVQVVHLQLSSRRKRILTLSNIYQKNLRAKSWYVFVYCWRNNVLVSNSNAVEWALFVRNGFNGLLTIIIAEIIIIVCIFQL